MWLIYQKGADDRDQGSVTADKAVKKPTDIEPRLLSPGPTARYGVTSMLCFASPDLL